MLARQKSTACWRLSVNLQAAVTFSTSCQNTCADGPWATTPRDCRAVCERALTNWYALPKHPPYTHVPQDIDIKNESGSQVQCCVSSGTLRFLLSYLCCFSACMLRWSAVSKQRKRRNICPKEGVAELVVVMATCYWSLIADRGRISGLRHTFGTPNASTCWKDGVTVCHTNPLQKPSDPVTEPWTHTPYCR